MIISGRAKDLTGQRFGYLTVISRAENRVSKNGKQRVYWNCLCDCGNKVDVRTDNLTNGETFSCGCYAKRRHSECMREIIAREPSHGMVGTRIYHIWGNMLSRCRSETNPVYYRYGGRGIHVCDEWYKFENFYEWALSSGYDESLTLDRIDNNQGYNPDNCRWATMKEQNVNKRNNVYYEFNGEDLTLSQIADIVGINYKTIHRRVHSLGWDVNRAVTEPIHKN